MKAENSWNLMKVCESCTFQVVFVGAPNVSFPEYNEPWETWKTIKTSKFCPKGGKVFAGAIHLHRSTRGGAKHRDTSDNDAVSFSSLMCWHTLMQVNSYPYTTRQLTIGASHSLKLKFFEVMQSRKPLWHQCAWFAQVICGISSLAHLCWFMDWMLKAWQKSGMFIFQVFVYSSEVCWLSKAKLWTLLAWNLDQALVFDVWCLFVKEAFWIDFEKIWGGNHNLMDKLTMGSELTWT